MRYEGCQFERISTAVRASVVGARAIDAIVIASGLVSMADGTSAVTLTCQSCDLTTTQAPGARRRTVCPHCGNFYHRQDASTTPQPPPHATARSNAAAAHSSTSARNHQPNLERYARRPPTDRLPHLDAKKVAFSVKHRAGLRPNCTGAALP